MDGTDYLRPGVGITLVTGSSGEVTISTNSNSVAKAALAGDTNLISGNVLTFSSIGTLNSADWESLDVYLNGAYLSNTYDLSNITTTSVQIDAGIVNSLVPGDVISVTLRNIVA